MSVFLGARTSRRLIAMAVLLILSVTSGYAALVELSPIIRDPQTAQLRVVSLSDGSMRPAFSTASHNLVLRACLETVTSAYGRLLPAARRSGLLEQCASDAQQVLASTPTSGFGQFMTAFIALERDDVELAAQAIARSALTSRNEYWLARLRANFVEANFEQLGASAAAGHGHDLFLALHAEPGRSELARLYWQNAGTADRLKLAAEQLSIAQQDKFVWAVTNQRPPNAN